MQIADAQRANRVRFRGGFYGQLVSGVLWLTSAELATWSTPKAAILLTAGLMMGRYLPGNFAIGAWYPGIALVVVAMIGRALVARELAGSAAVTTA